MTRLLSILEVCVLCLMLAGCGAMSTRQTSQPAQNVTVDVELPPDTPGEMR
jgi:PBP1b-binding outer membrane lipoprotein LpoB